MNTQRICASYAKSKLDDFTTALKELGYKDSTIKEHRKKILRFLKLNNDSQITTEALKEYINNHCDKGYSKRYTISVKKSINVFYNFLCTNSIDLSRIKRDTYTFSEEDEVLVNSFLLKYSNKCQTDSINRKRITLWRFLNDINNEKICIKELDEKYITSNLLNKNYDDVRIIKSFLNYLFVEGNLSIDLSLFIHPITRVKKSPSVYTDDEIYKIINYYSENNLIGLRNKIIIMLATTTGLRSCDIVRLKLSDINMSKNQISIVQHKTKKPISLYINDELKKLILSYHSLSEHRKHGHLFSNEKAPYGPMSTGSIRYLLKKAIINLGIKKEGRKTGPHSLRSSFATSLAQNNVSYDVIQKILGHKDNSSLCSYVLTDVEKLRKCSLPTYNPSGSFLKWLGEV